MKTNSSELFDLIKSLNTQEKKRIRKEMIQNKKGKKTVLLYDIIIKQKKFDDTLIQKKLGNPKWYAQLKRYLLEQVSNKLLHDISDNTNYTYVLKSILLAEQFYGKGLINSAKKKLEKASVLCQKNGWLEYIPIINSKLSNIIGIKQEQRKQYDFYPKAYNDLHQSYLEKKYSILFRCVEYADRTKQTPLFLNDLKIEECLADEQQLTTLLQKLHYYQFLASYYKNVTADYSRSYFYCKKYLDVVIEKIRAEEKDTTISNDRRVIHFRNTMVGLLNVIIAAVNANFLCDLYELFRLFTNLEKKYNLKHNSDLTDLYNTNRQMIFFIISSATITRIGKENSAFNTWFDKFKNYEQKLHRQDIISCQELIALYLFMKNKWNSCSAIINKIINDSEIYKIHPDSYGSVLLLRLFINYEKDDIDSLDYNLKRTERYFEKYYAALGYEKLILAFFNAIVNNHFTDRIKLMQNYSSKLNYLLQNDKKFATTYLTERIFIDFESWLQAKITNSPLIEILKKKPTRKSNF